MIENVKILTEEYLLDRVEIKNKNMKQAISS